MVGNLIPPHGGKLIERLKDLNDRDVILSETRELPRLRLSSKEVSDLIMLAIGAFSPLEGFLNREDYNCVISFLSLFLHLKKRQIN
jgi:sulfate adenylyltransferase